MFMATNTRFDQLVTSCSHECDDGSANRNSWNNDRSSSKPSHTFAPKLAKIDSPRFKGNEHPTCWVCIDEQFFQFQGMPDAEKVPLKAYHLEGEAQLW